MIPTGRTVLHAGDVLVLAESAASAQKLQGK